MFFHISGKAGHKSFLSVPIPSQMHFAVFESKKHEIRQMCNYFLTHSSGLYIFMRCHDSLFALICTEGWVCLVDIHLFNSL